MNTFEAIKSRKSNRAYNGQAVEHEKLEQIAQAGTYAAAGMGKPVYITVVTNPAKIQMLNDNTKQVMLNSGNDFMVKAASNPAWNPLFGAPAIMLISALTATDPQSISTNTSNCACAGENILLAATELGVASCFVTSPTLGFMIPGTKEALEIPDEQTVSAIITLGYSDDKEPHGNHINENNIAWVD